MADSASRLNKQSKTTRVTKKRKQKHRQNNCVMKGRSTNKTHQTKIKRNNTNASKGAIKNAGKTTMCDQGMHAWAEVLPICFLRGGCM